MAQPSRRRGGSGESPSMPTTPRELIVLLRSEASATASQGTLMGLSDPTVDPVQRLLEEAGARITPLFGASEARVRAAMGPQLAMAGGPDPSKFYKVDADDGRLDALAAALAAEGAVEAAYVKPPASPAAFLNDASPAPEEAPPATPDFTGRQGYLNAAPGGVDARWAWTQGGGRGVNVNIIDVEGAWRFSHEDLQASQGGVVGGVQSGEIGWRNHGTAVIGVFGGDLNATGITGIAPAAVTTAHSIFGPGNGSAAAIRAAASRMRAGDILLIELHRPGPRFNFAGRDDQRGYIAVEWWPDDFAAILFATSRGVIVVEAGGNGAENLDDPIYNNRPSGFPTTWRNPFNRANPDCGAVIVGAGAPPTLNFGPDRSRLDFSNFGACVDAQGWGRDVCTTGYGDLQGGGNEDLWYTATFSGTSSASPVVVGALACVQGILRNRGATLLTPTRARQVLRATGSPQTDAPGRPASQRIGNRPDIRAIAQNLLGKSVIKDVKDKDKDKEKLEIKETKDHKEKVEIKELKDKEKEFKEGKEIKEFKEGKEIKEFKEKDIRDVQRKELVEHKAREVFGGGQPSAASDLEARVAALETQLAHFIPQELRPEVGGSVYGDPQQIQALQQEAQAQLDAAKAAKDHKDVEV